MNNRKLELKITTDSNGREIDLTNLSVIAAKSLNLMLDSLIKIIEATPHGNDLRIKVVKGSATLLAEGSETIITRMENDFREVAEYTSVKNDIVSNWRNIQTLISRNGLNYEVNFYNSSNVKQPFLDKLKNTKAFRVKVERKPKDFELTFVHGKLIENGGVSPNLHLKENGQDKIIACSHEVAKKLNQHLYGDLYVSAWKKRNDSKAKLEYCDSYLSADDFFQYKNFIAANNDLQESDEYVAIHEKIKGYVAANDFGRLKKLLRLYNHKSSDFGSLKTILLVTKTFKEKEDIKDLRLSIKKILDSKLKKSTT